MQKIKARALIKIDAYPIDELGSEHLGREILLFCWDGTMFMGFFEKRTDEEIILSHPGLRRCFYFPIRRITAWNFKEDCRFLEQ